MHVYIMDPVTRLKVQETLQHCKTDPGNLSQEHERRGSLGVGFVVKRYDYKRTRHASHSHDPRHDPVREDFRLKSQQYKDMLGIERMEIQDLADADVDKIYGKFMKAHNCYDLIPMSSKLLVFDTKLLVKKAFFALVYNNVRAAPLWDSVSEKFVGMLTITDFIQILQRSYKSPNEKMEDLETDLIETWRNKLPLAHPGIVSIDPRDNLYEAVKRLTEGKVHRLAVVDGDSNDALYILTHKRLLKFLYLFLHELPEPDFMKKSIEELNVGTFDNVATVNADTPVIQALRLFVERRVSALPVLDRDRKVVDIYSKFDVINLAAEKTYNNLDVSVSEALMYRLRRLESVSTCRKSNSLRSIVEIIARAEVHRLVIVDDKDTVAGVISLSDILSYLVLKPMQVQEGHKDVQIVIHEMTPIPDSDEMSSVNEGDEEVMEVDDPDNETDVMQC